MKYFLRLPLLKMFCPWKKFEKHVNWTFSRIFSAPEI